jgi:hypothetical protein
MTGRLEHSRALSADTVATACLCITRAIEEERPFDVILCSVGSALPDTGNLVDIARTSQQWPVFLYVAAYFELDGVKALPEADGVLIKPFTSKEVEDLVWRILVERDRAWTRQWMKLDN